MGETITLEKAVNKLLVNKIRVDGKTIYARPNQFGLKMLKYVDYLTNYCGYKVSNESSTKAKLPY